MKTHFDNQKLAMAHHHVSSICCVLSWMKSYNSDAYGETVMQI